MITKNDNPTLAELELALDLAVRRYGKWSVIACQIREQVDDKKRELAANEQPGLFDV